MKGLTKACFIALALVLMVAPLLACGGAETPEPETPTGNQPPVVSLTAEETTVIPSKVVKIYYEATDPDADDELTLSWTTPTGEITDTYTEFIYWEAPDFEGECTISLTADDGQGHSVTEDCTIIVQTTQAPVVSSVIAEPAELQPDETATITCTASDPEGDPLNYNWSASGGTLTGSGETVTWHAPTVTGEFVITVNVDDGKGGTAEGVCRIVVGLPTTTVILEPLPGESGTISSDGDIVPEFRIGDNADNVALRPYFSYDITALEGAEIKEARLVFTIRGVIGEEPWFTPPYLYVESLDYGAQSLQASFYHTVLTLGSLHERYSLELPTEIDVQGRLINYLEWLKPRFQVRIYLEDPGHNFNGQADYVEFSNAELIISYVK
jgi:hypothetical protein